jgi:hypothetical protein
MRATAGGAAHVANTKERMNNGTQASRWNQNGQAHRAMKIDPLLEEAFVAACVMTAIGAAVAFFYWVLTDLSPWPYVVLCEVAALGFGIVLLALSSPKKYR